MTKGKRVLNRENKVKIGLATGFVDAKLASISEQWSSYKFVLDQNTEISKLNCKAN